MVVRFLIVLLVALQIAAADVVQLKDKSSVTGKILAEKRDQVFVDLGYTVLAIPRNQVAKISTYCISSYVALHLLGLPRSFLICSMA